MVNSQFTPRQVLEAGRRAENDGQREYAIQFYQHVLAHPAATDEAEQAADALRRLEGGGEMVAGRDPRVQAYAGPPIQTPAPARPAQLSQGFHPQTNKNPPLRQVTGPPAAYPAIARSTYEIDPVPPTQSSAHRQGARKSKDKTRSAEAASEGHDEKRARAGSKGRKSYRFGRFLAATLGMVGFIGAIAGMVSLGANFVLWATRMQNGLLSMLASSPLVAALLMAGACVLILLSQMAKATFDAADRRSPSASDE